MNVLYDMETQDPDDLFALAILASHPKVNLRAVCLTPGSLWQADLIRHVLKRLGKENVLLGAYNPLKDKKCISEWWYEFLGEPKYAGGQLELGWVLYEQMLAEYLDLVIITGGPLKNLGAFLRAYPDSCIGRWVAQGGFAGDCVVPEKYRLAKFAGRNTCPTFNFNGDPKSALLALDTGMVWDRRLISKNVCHGLTYDQTMHEQLSPYRDRNAGLQLVYDGMEFYLKKHGRGKMFHDPLAVCAAINHDIIEYREVKVYRENGEWGSRLSSGTNTWISIRADHQAFFDTMVGN